MPVPLIPIGVGLFLMFGRRAKALPQPKPAGNAIVPPDKRAHEKTPAEIERDAVTAVAGALGGVAAGVGGAGVGALAAGRVLGGYYLGKYLTGGSQLGGIAGAISNEAIVAEAGAAAADSVAKALGVDSPGAIAIAKVGGGSVALLLWAGFTLAALPLLLTTVIAVWIADWLELGARTQADAQREFDDLRRKMWDAIYPAAVKGNAAYGERFAASFVDGYAWTFNRAAYRKYIGSDTSYAHIIEGWRTGQFVGLPPSIDADPSRWDVFPFANIRETPVLDGSFVATIRSIPDREIRRRTLAGNALTRKGDQVPFSFTMAYDVPFYPAWLAGRFAANVSLYIAWLQSGMSYGDNAAKAAVGLSIGAFEGALDGDALVYKDPIDGSVSWRYSFDDYIAAGQTEYSPSARAQNAMGEYYDPSKMTETESIRTSVGGAARPMTAEERKHTLK